MFNEENPKRLAQIALIVLLIIGCIAVLWPMIGAVLFSFVLWICTWSFYSDQVLPRLGGRNALGATLMTLALVLLMLLPMLFLATSLAHGADRLIEFVKPYIEQGLPIEPPGLLDMIPFFGADLKRSWLELAGDRQELNSTLKQLIGPARQFALMLGGIAANGLLQLALTLFVLFFLYRDGELLANSLRVAAHKLGGDLGDDMLEKTRGTVIGVMLGIVGTAAAQGTVAMIGFLIVGAPGAVLLGFATFFLSMVPIGPPLIWGGVTVWLYAQGETAWAIFMVLYGLLIVSSIDNFLKPVLMARGSGISILLIALGVLGGIFVFGFIGIFLGPVLLALGEMLFKRWTREESVA